MNTEPKNILAFQALPTPAAPQAPGTSREAEQATSHPDNVVPFRVKRRSAKAQVPMVHGGNAQQRVRDDSFTLGHLWNAISDGRTVNHYQPQ